MYRYPQLHPDKVRNVQKILGRRKRKKVGASRLVENLARQIVAQNQAAGDRSRQGFFDRERNL